MIQQSPRLIPFDSPTDPSRVHESDHVLCGAIARPRGEVIVSPERLPVIPRVGIVSIKVHFSQQKDRIRVIPSGRTLQQLDRFRQRLVERARLVFRVELVLLWRTLQEKKVESFLGVICRGSQEAGWLVETCRSFLRGLEVSQDGESLLNRQWICVELFSGSLIGDVG